MQGIILTLSDIRFNSVNLSKNVIDLPIWHAAGWYSNPW